jgi:hypothetical protein
VTLCPIVVLTHHRSEVGMDDTHTLVQASVEKVGARIEITLVAEDGARVTFTASPEQADELAEDLEEILDEMPPPRGDRGTMQ